MILDQAAAVLAGVAGFSLGVREIVLSPRNETFPQAPCLVRLSMFVLSAALAAMAIVFWSAVGPLPYAGRAEVLLVLVLATQAVANVVLLVNLLRQRYRPEVWRRLNKATAIVKASCGERGGLRMRTDP